ncbi:MAG: cobalamin B12-binding domain-containing protein, partial [Bdellovibrionales bacterium]|nr:cobalamin B12-binding domain-containing protein [Oligoflexia bacterium]
IGKNIVSVVLACNGYRVVDLGVMVKCEDILKAAVAEKADFLGLSGLITPSLDEMIHVAQEMKREGFTLPLLIGGATTSAAHTAIKIAQHYDEPMVQVGDASLVVEVCTKLKSPTLKEKFVTDLKVNQKRMRESFEKSRLEAVMLSLPDARERKYQANWSAFTPKQAPFSGAKVLEAIPLKEVAAYIDWSPFFWSWELKGKYPAIFNHPKHGDAARKLFEDAEVLLKDVIENERFQLKATYGYYQAQTTQSDDVVLTKDQKEVAKFHFLRQQKEKQGEPTYYCLSDFIAPEELKKSDVLGMFCVTAGSSVETHANSFRDQHDDYSSIIIKALGDRFAEATAEWLHAKVRSEMGMKEDLKLEDILSEKYEGIRPAIGYPACPDHSEKDILWSLLHPDQTIGVTLTSSYAMNPPSSVSGLYFFNPEARYFNVGTISEEQLKEYTLRKGTAPERTRTLLSPNLS